MTELATQPAEARTGVKRISHWIGGRLVAGESGRSGPVYNPATGRQSGEVDFATAEEVDKAVQAAKAAFVSWRQVSLAKRAELFFAIRELVHERREEVATLLTQEHGKVLSDAIGEVTRGLEVIEFCCGLPTLLKSEYSEQASTGVDVYSIRQPLGVVAGITPFNFPAMVPMWMWAPALATGNTVVVVPSETYPLITSDLYQVFDTSDLPGGAVNIVTGDTAQLLKALAEHDDVDAIWCFTDEASASAAKSYSKGNLKQVFTNEGRSVDWFDVKQGEGRWFLQHATQVKNIWVPYGE